MTKVPLTKYKNVRHEYNGYRRISVGALQSRKNVFFVRRYNSAVLMRVGRLSSG